MDGIDWPFTGGSLARACVGSGLSGAARDGAWSAGLSEPIGSPGFSADGSLGLGGRFPFVESPRSPVEGSLGPESEWAPFELPGSPTEGL